jgi:hypothetical protein
MPFVMFRDSARSRKKYRRNIWIRKFVSFLNVEFDRDFLMKITKNLKK